MNPLVLIAVGSSLLTSENMFSVFGCEIIVLDDKEDVSDAEELTRDLMALLASFSGKYYGRRSLERRKKK